MEWLNFRHLYAFWAVCRSGGFRRAAERIRVSQSTISAQVSELEDYLDEVLIERSTRALRVTDRGRALLARADEIFALSAGINRAFRDKLGGEAPTNIRVGVVGGISRNFLFRRILAALDGASPPRLELVDGSYPELEGLLRGYELDLIFTLDRPRSKDLVSATHRRVASSPLCIAGTPDLIATVEGGGWPRDTPVPLYVFRHAFEGPAIDTLVAERLGVDVDVPVLTDDISLLRFLANGGRGLAAVPEIGVREDLDAGRVARLSLPQGPQIDVFAIFLRDAARRSLIDAFLASA